MDIATTLRHLIWHCPKLLWLAVFLLADNGCASAPANNENQSNIRYQLGVNLYINQQHEAALKELQASLESDPNNADAYLLLGTIALNEGHDYLIQMETASCLKGSDANSVRLEATQKFLEAAENFEKAVEIRPEFSDAWNNLSVAALNLQDWKRAAAAGIEALKDVTFGRQEIARANLGWAYFHLGNMTKAWKQLHTAVSRNADLCVGRYRLAKVYFERNEYDRASAELDAIMKNKECPIQDAYLLAGLVAQKKLAADKTKKTKTAAAQYFGQCISLAPRSCLAEECKRYREMLN